MTAMPTGNANRSSTEIIGVLLSTVQVNTEGCAHCAVVTHITLSCHTSILTAID